MSDYDCLKNHIEALGTVDTEVEGRIVVSKCIMLYPLHSHLDLSIWLEFDDSEVTTEDADTTTSVEDTTTSVEDTTTSVEDTTTTTGNEDTTKTTPENSASFKNPITFLVVMLVFLLKKM